MSFVDSFLFVWQCIVLEWNSTASVTNKVFFDIEIEGGEKGRVVRILVLIHCNRKDHNVCRTSFVSPPSDMLHIIVRSYDTTRSWVSLVTMFRKR